MRRTILQALPLLLLLGWATPTRAQEGDAGLAGAWTLTFTTSQGTVDLPIELRPEGEVLRGTSGSAMGFQTDFEDGTVEDGTFAFAVFVEVEGDWYPLYFDGQMEGAELTGRVDIPDGSRATFRGRRPAG